MTRQAFLALRLGDVVRHRRGGVRVIKRYDFETEGFVLVGDPGDHAGIAENWERLGHIDEFFAAVVELDKHTGLRRAVKHQIEHGRSACSGEFVWGDWYDWTPSSVQVGA